MRPTILLILFAATTWAQDALTVSKAVYDQKVQAAREEFAARRAELDPAQPRHLAALEKITQDRQLQLARAARAYLDDLDSTKRSLIKIGDLEGAAAVGGEISNVSTSVDLSVLTKPAVQPARPAPVIASTPALPVTSVEVNPTGGLRPMRDDLWVTAQRSGVPVRGVRFIFVPSGAGKSVEKQTDGLGKITLRSENGYRYHIALVTEKFQFQHFDNVTAGNTYQFNIADTPAGSGAIYIKEKEHQIYLPSAGLVNVGRWPGGQAFSAPTPIFRQKQNAKNLAPSVQAHYDEPFRIAHEDTEYEATLIHTGPGEACWLKYTKVK